MRSWVARRTFAHCARRYGYDISYLLMMLNEFPSAFFRFVPVMKAASHREVVPADASFAATSSVARGGLRSLHATGRRHGAGSRHGEGPDRSGARRDPRAMNDATTLGFRFADAVVRRSADDEEFRDAVRAQRSQKGVIDLTLALQLGRMFPMVKGGLGYAKECRRVTVDGHNVDVVKQAA